MRVRPLAFCVVLLGAALGTAACSSSDLPTPSSGSPAPGASHVGTPTGTVTVKSGGKVVCVITLNKNGTGTCKVNTTNARPGKYTFTGTYSGDSQFRSANGSTTVTLQPAKQTS